MLTNNMIQQQQLLGAIRPFTEFIKEHINDYTNANSEGLRNWIKSPYGQACITGKDFYHIQNISIVEMPTKQEIALDIKMTRLYYEPNIPIYYYTPYVIRIASSDTSLSYICGRIWAEILRGEDFVEDFEEFWSGDYLQPIRDFEKYYRAEHADLII